MNRQGVALIIAISVLAALLFLALPFVFSQSASVAGARASSWDGMARRGSDRALGLSTALATYATGLHRSPALALQLQTAQLAYVQIPRQVGDLNGPIHYPSDAPNSWRSIIATGEPWTFSSGNLPGLDSAQTVHGAIIEDESRRIEPNSLDMYGWAVVLKRAGIQDPWTVEMKWDGARNAQGDWVPATPAYHWQMLTFGRLARALTLWRPGNGSRRFNRLEDLLGADPQQLESWYGVNSYLGCVHFGPQGGYPSRGQTGWPVNGQDVEGTREAAEVDIVVKDSSNIGWRVAPLTQSELERLRPLLSFLIPGQGRSGVIDLGTVVAEETRSGDWWGVVTDELSQSDMGLVGTPLRTSHTWTRSGSNARRSLDNGWAHTNDPLGLDAIPTMNLNTVPSSSGMTRLYLAQLYGGGEPNNAAGDAVFQGRIEGLGWPQDPVSSPITSIGRMPALRWLDPRTGDGVIAFERPPLGLNGYGIVAVEGLSTVRDQQGNAVASRRRRTVVQAVSQERPFEASWVTQGDFEGLVRLRHGSWVQAGPHPTNRILDWGSQQAGQPASQGRDDMLALDGPGWLEPAPLCSMGYWQNDDGVNRKRHADAISPVDWRLPFGLTKAQTWADVLKETDVLDAPVGTGPVDQPAQLRASGTSVGALTSQGLRLISPSALSYVVSNTAGPLRFSGNGAMQEMSARQISMRFCLPNDPGTSAVTLLETRNQAPDPPSEAQNLWRVEYRPDDRMLVMIIANSALPWTGVERGNMHVDSWKTGTDKPVVDADVDVDARCLGNGAYDFAPPDPATRVEFRYKLASPLTVGQWYHLQAFCASDRPGLHGLLLDGIVGRDGTRPGVDMTQTGDHYTWPSMRLSGSPIAQVPTSPRDSGGSALILTDINVTFPADLQIGNILPTRGMIRIDDEYFSYTGILDTGVGTGAISGVQRARRVDTDQSGLMPATPPATGMVNDEDIRWPVVQQHAAGSVVTPGWAQRDGITGTWLRGEGKLVQDFPATLVQGAIDAGSFGPGVDASTKSLGGTVIVGGASWPDRGLVRFTWSGGVAVAAFTGPGNNLALEWGGNTPVTAAPQNIPNAAVVTATLISLQIDGDVVAANLWQDGGLVQLLDITTGLCEWIRITGRSEQIGIAAGKYLYNDSGWDMTQYTTPNPPVPSLQPRGAMRTPQRTTAWPKATTDVLPVQTLTRASGAPGIVRLEAGDIVTVVSNVVDDGTGARHLPVQLLVRYATRDGFPLDPTKSGARYDTINGFFALTHKVPDELPDPSASVPAIPQTAIIGRGWSGDDLSMKQNHPSRRGCLMRKDLLSTAGGPAGVAKIFIGSSDPRSARSQDVIIDDLSAGPSAAGVDANEGPANGAGSSIPNGCEIQAIASPSGAITVAADALPVDVTASRNIFDRQYGLILIDGEVFAYRRQTANVATLIARGLLGSAQAEHRLTLDAAAVPMSTVVKSNDNQPPNRTIQQVLPAITLPVGPVAELCSDLPAGVPTSTPAVQPKGFDVVEVPYGNYYKDPVDFGEPDQNSYAGDSRLIMKSPFVLVHEPAYAGSVAPGAQVELMRLFVRPASNQRITAGWLRGVYGTTNRAWHAPYAPVLAGDRPAAWIPPPSGSPSNWSPPPATPIQPQAGGQLNPILIGWWPRFAPGLTDNPGAEALRSRCFAWAGFALRLSGTRFDGHISTSATDPGGVAVLLQSAGGIADVGVQTGAGCTLTAIALAAEEQTGLLFDWDKAWPNRSTLLSTNANVGLVGPFNWNRFWLKEVDGAELRVHWAATGNGVSELMRAADAAGRMPRLEKVRLRCVAPNRVLAVEEVR